jgi:hypothetical protein
MTTPSSSSNSNETPPPTAATNVVTTNAVAVKIPPFWPCDPELWFAQVEAQFKEKNITSQGTKCAHVVAALSPEAATEVRDSLLRRGFNELYMAFTVSNRCVEDAQAEKAGSETSARSRSKKC